MNTLVAIAGTPELPVAQQIMQQCRATLEKNSKTFALAARLLPPASRDRAAALYTYCRHVDDAIDDTPAAQQESALARLREELELAYRPDVPLVGTSLEAFRAVVATTHLPALYPRELLEGMAMDVHGARYETVEQLLLYCHRVASVVGLMMCHVLGVTHDGALRQAAQLGMAMQLTNICRDVAEDYTLGRLYLPGDLLRAVGADVPRALRGELPSQGALREAMPLVMKQLLLLADRYYESAERGIAALPFRGGLAARAALHLYRAIGFVIASRGYDPGRGRAVVSNGRKLLIVLKVLALHTLSTPRMLWQRLVHGRPRLPRATLQFPEQVLREE